MAVRPKDGLCSYGGANGNRHPVVEWDPDTIYKIAWPLPTTGLLRGSFGLLLPARRTDGEEDGGDWLIKLPTDKLSSDDLEHESRVYQYIGKNTDARVPAYFGAATIQTPAGPIHYIIIEDLRSRENAAGAKNLLSWLGSADTATKIFGRSATACELVLDLVTTLAIIQRERFNHNPKRHFAHRDLKPDNLYVERLAPDNQATGGAGPRPRLILLDLGTARSGFDGTVRGSGRLGATPGWAAPEQSALLLFPDTEDDNTRKSSDYPAVMKDHTGIKDSIRDRHHLWDIYTIGLLAYWMLVDSEIREFRKQSLRASLMRLTIPKEACPISQVRDVLNRCLCVDPNDRFPDIIALESALRTALYGEDDTPARLRLRVPSDYPDLTEALGIARGTPWGIEFDGQIESEEFLDKLDGVPLISSRLRFACAQRFRGPVILEGTHCVDLRVVADETPEATLEFRNCTVKNAVLKHLGRISACGSRFEDSEIETLQPDQELLISECRFERTVVTAGDGRLALDQCEFEPGAVINVDGNTMAVAHGCLFSPNSLSVSGSEPTVFVNGSWPKPNWLTARGEGVVVIVRDTKIERGWQQAESGAKIIELGVDGALQLRRLRYEETVPGFDRSALEAVRNRQRHLDLLDRAALEPSLKSLDTLAGVLGSTSDHDTAALVRAALVGTSAAGPLSAMEFVNRLRAAVDTSLIMRDAKHALKSIEDALDTEVQNLRITVVDLEEDVTNLEKTLKQLRRELNKAEVERAGLQQALEEDVAQLARVAQLEKTRERLETELAKAEVERASLQKTVDERSTSIELDGNHSIAEHRGPRRLMRDGAVFVFGTVVGAAGLAGIALLVLWFLSAAT